MSKADDVRRSLEELARQSFGVGYRGVISRPIPQPAELPTLHASLRRALPVLAGIGIQGHVVAQNELARHRSGHQWGMVLETRNKGRCKLPGLLP